jgi:hypothetical protein
MGKVLVLDQLGLLLWDPWPAGNMTEAPQSRKEAGRVLALPVCTSS